MHQQALLLPVKWDRVNGGEQKLRGAGTSCVQRHGSDGKIASYPRDWCSSFGAVRNDSWLFSYSPSVHLFLPSPPQLAKEKRTISFHKEREGNKVWNSSKQDRQARNRSEIRNMFHNGKYKRNKTATVSNLYWEDKCYWKRNHDDCNCNQLACIWTLPSATFSLHTTTRERRVNRFFVAAWSYQILAGFWDSADIHRPPLNGIDKPSFSHSDGTDHMNPPGDSERKKDHETFCSLVSSFYNLYLQILFCQCLLCSEYQLDKSLGFFFFWVICEFASIFLLPSHLNTNRCTNRLSMVVFKAPPLKLQRQHSWKNR